MLIMSYLEPFDILPSVPCCCRFFQEVVWGKWSGALLWGEMGRCEMGNAIDKHPWVRYRDEYLDENGDLGIWINGPYTSALSKACENDAPFRHIHSLIRGGANVHYPNRHYLYPLQLTRNVDVTRALLEAKADPNKDNNDNIVCETYPPLMSASYYGDVERVKMLIQYGANVNWCGVDGYNALFRACELKKLEVVRELLSAGANINARDHKGRTALDIARSMNNHECVELLELFKTS